MPHGPANAVKGAAIDEFHGPEGFGGGGIFTASGWPDSIRVMSFSGPFGPIFHGVWQSLQPRMVTRYLPRSTGEFAAGALGSADPRTATNARIAAIRHRIIFFKAKPPWEWKDDPIEARTGLQAGYLLTSTVYPCG